MKKILGVLGVVAMVMGTAALANEGQAVKHQTKCPVMGGSVNTNLYVDADGKRIYACCPGCLPALKKDPAKYIAQLEKEGITLDKAPAGGQ